VTVTKPFRPRSGPGEVTGVTAMAAELLEVLWGRADTAPVSSSQLRVLLILDAHDDINLRTLAGRLGSTPPRPAACATASRPRASSNARRARPTAARCGCA
jgi:hypothetical protein